MKFRSSCSHLTTRENLCTTRGAAGFDKSQRTRSPTELEVLPYVGRTSLSAMIAKSPVRFILLDSPGSGHGITPTTFGSAGLLMSIIETPWSLECCTYR